MTTTLGIQSPGEYFAKMMRVASDLGCQLQPNPQNRNQLRGLCPFHEADKLQNLKTLVVNTNTRKFWCTFCNIGGNPLAFMAMAWSISAWDARILATNEENQMTALRPPYPQEYFHPDPGGAPTPQNTAILTLATRYYGDTMMTNYEPLFMLARLGIRPEIAREAGVGYCTGQGLREYLMERGVTREEMRASPLFNPNTGAEVMNRRITLSDQDYTGATLWMTSTVPEEMRENNDWKNDKPSTYGIPGMRPFLFNNKSITRPGIRLVVTDDIRLHLLLECNRIASTLITRRYQPSDGHEEFARQIAGKISERGIQHLTIAVHNRQRSYDIRESFLQSSEHNRELSLYRQDIMETLNNPQENLGRFRNIPRRQNEPENPEDQENPENQENPEDQEETRVSPPTIPQPEDPVTPGT